MMSEEEIRKELAMGNIVCPECSDSLMNFEYDENDNCIYVCPKCGYDIEAENYDYFFESELYNNDEYEDEPRCRMPSLWRSISSMQNILR